ncbi:MAG: 5-(carboxyamino)imidazole ribonucleotide synthase [Lentisphaerales bacterium]|nr:5-(carboxyamino)imidazole ribonucleotide synthase [Lentisphaerales bacterium]
MKTIGIIGGGQLGRMMTKAAKKLGFNVTILDPGENSPAGQVADKQIIGSWNDPVAIREIVTQCDVTTYDLEHINTDALIELAEQGHTIHPDPRVLKIIQDKYTQKSRLQECGVDIPAFVKQDEGDTQAFYDFGFPLVQKTRTGGYDGKGVLVIKSEEDLEKALPGPCMLEKMVDLKMELGVMVSRSLTGEIVTYPVTEMTFDDRSNILDLCIVPGRISEELTEKAQKLAHDTMEAFGGVGIFGVELFVDKNGDLSVNEVAPRPHNSGHYTIEACVTSQYEQHIRAVAGLPLGSSLQARPSVMYNLMGEPEEEGIPFVAGLKEILELPEVSLHMYGKKETRPFRKMGHITVTADTVDKAVEVTEKVKSIVKIIAES